MPSIDDVAMAAGAAASPPEAMMPTNANCDPPVKSTSESTWDCQMSSPAATARAPKLMP